MDARDRAAKCFVQFPWPEEQLEDLHPHLRNRLYQLDTIPPQRIEYDFLSKSVHLDMAESMLHSLLSFFSALLLKVAIDELVPSIHNTAIRRRLKAVVNFTTSRLKVTGKLSRQADWAFGCATNPLPPLVCEVAFGQSWKDVKAKALQYIKCSSGKIIAAIIFDINYPEADKVTVSLVTADDSVSDGYC